MLSQNRHKGIRGAHELERSTDLVILVMSDVVHPQGGHEGTEMGLFPPRDSPNKPIVMKTEAHVCRTSEIATAGQGSEGKTEPSARALNQGSGRACDRERPH